MPMPMKPAATCVSNSCVGQRGRTRASRIERSCSAAWATISPGPPRISPNGVDVDGERVDRARARSATRSARARGAASTCARRGTRCRARSAARRGARRRARRARPGSSIQRGFHQRRAASLTRAVTPDRTVAELLERREHVALVFGEMADDHVGAARARRGRRTRRRRAPGRRPPAPRDRSPR